MALAIDAAASEFFDKKTGRYTLTGEKRDFDGAGMVGYWQDLCSRYPIVSLEDGMSEDDWEGWRRLQ